MIGRLDVDEELSLADVAHEVELHVETGTADRVSMAVGSRVKLREGLRYYRLDGRPSLGVDPRCRRLSSANLNEVSELFESYYPDAVFSTWMLDLPFIGLFEEDALIACGGVIGLAAGIVNIGNFLTIPHARGRGLARAVAASLTHSLVDVGISISTLGITDGNLAACRAYEAAGFRYFDRRVQLNLTPIAP